MADRFLDGVRVVDAGGRWTERAGRILADLGATVVRLEPEEGDPRRWSDREALRFAVWNVGKQSVALTGDPEDLADLLDGADIVLHAPAHDGTVDLARDHAPRATWVSVSPFGAEGRRSGWRASDLGVMASSGNMFVTGDPDRPPVRPSEPAAEAHTGPEVAIAALTGFAAGGATTVDVSMQEAVLAANMSGPATFPRTGERGRRRGARIGRTQEIWPCRDGYVSFALRGGKARARNFEILTKLVDAAGLATPALLERDWAAYNHNELSDEELGEIAAPIAAFFATRSMSELYEIACETNLMLAPANSPKEIYQSAQLDERGFFGAVGDLDGLPVSFARASVPGGSEVPVGPVSGVPEPGSSAPAWPKSAREGTAASLQSGRPAWEGVKILEFGSGAAGPLATRYFAEHGATVIKVEARSRPDFLRVSAALDPSNPHGLEGSPLFACLNSGKLGCTLNLKHPEGLALAKRLVAWADVVTENFAPRVMTGLGLGFDALVEEKPDLIMVSSCLNGHTGPHRDYPGFGGQGSALAGFNFVTGWPDREPIGPFGTITDSLAPRFTATLIAAALLRHRRTGSGIYVDLSQVETGVYSLSPWLLEWRMTGEAVSRMGNRSRDAVPHGAFRCAGEDRWVAVAAWSDDEWQVLAKIAGLDGAAYPALADRLGAVDEIEAALTAWTSTRSPHEVAEELQAAGVEAVPVADFGDLHADPQLEARGHFVPGQHPATGDVLHERNGFRVAGRDGGYERAAPVLGEHNDLVFGEFLGLTESQREALEAEGVFT